MNNDTLEVELQITDDKAEVVLSRNKQRLEDFVKETKKIQPNIKFSIPKESFIDLDKLEKRAAETRRNFEAIAKTRLESGNIGLLTKEVVKAQERSRQLSSDIASIKKELANPNRKSSIAFLTDELRAAEKEADILNRKLSVLPNSSAAIASGTKGKTGGGRGGRITGEQAALLEILDDFAPTGLNKPFNSIARGALIAGDVKEAATGIKTAGKEMLALVGISGTALVTFGAIAAVGYGIVKVTQNIREEAERRLKVEEKIQSAINNQILSQLKALSDFKELREEAENSRSFSKFLDNGTIEQLKSQRATLEKLFSLNPTGANAEKFKNEIIAIDAQLVAIQEQKTRQADEAFTKRSELFEKSQKNAAEVEKKRNKEFQESVDKGKKKVEELGKTYESVFASLYQKSGANNPFVTVFAEGDRALKELRENLRGLSPELQKIAIDTQQRINSAAVYSARLDNSFSVFDLKETAANFRNPKESEEMRRARTDKTINNYLARNRDNNIAGGLNAGNALLRSNPNGLSDEKTKRDIYEYAVLDNVTRSGLNAKDFIPFLAQERLRKDENLSVQERIDKQLAIVNSSNPKTQDEIDIANRKIITLTQNLNPNDLRGDQRNAAAVANELEAARRVSAEKDANTKRDAEMKVLEDSKNYLKKLVEIAEKEGIKGIETLIKIKDETGRASFQQTPSPSDTANRMKQ